MMPECRFGRIDPVVKIYTCEHCEGEGTVYDEIDGIEGDFECPECEGEGKVETWK